MVVNKSASLFIIDEPDIYLHSDLQRQLVNALRSLGPDILIATHSTEILLEAESDEILTVTKEARSAKRIADPTKLRDILRILGSNAKPILTQVGRTEKLIFVEGKDFQVISRFANKLGVRVVATRSAFAVFPAEGFNPTKVKIFREGVEATTGSKISVAVVFDRDYRPDDEVANELKEMRLYSDYVHIHSRKELENFLLVPNALKRATVRKLSERADRTGTIKEFTEEIEILLSGITEPLKHDVQAQFLKRQHPFLKARDKSVDDTTITSQLLARFEVRWNDPNDRLTLVPGKDVLSSLNAHLQKNWGITLMSNAIIDAMTEDEIPDEIKEIISSLQQFAESS